MLSILIPVYAYDVTPLATELERQGEKLGVPFEIIIFDDGSHSEINNENELLNSLEHVNFEVLESNVGLSDNRNLLAQASKYDNLLFIDGDSLVRSDFLKNYLSSIHDRTEVIYGGRIHPENYADKNSLRWKYGKFIEDKTAAERKRHPYRSTLFNNTLVKKSIFEKVRFKKKLTKYGHEDTLFSFHLKKLKSKIQHIDNPVIHGDIDSNRIFLQKTILGLENLKYLYHHKMIDSEYVKLLRLYTALKKIGASNLLRFAFPYIENILKKNLLSPSPSLFFFNIYRLGYFCSLKP